MHLLEWYFRLRLDLLGYPGDELTLRYSIGFTQGDDVIVSGQLGIADIGKLAERMHLPADDSTAYKRLTLKRELKDLLYLIDFVEKYGDTTVEIACSGICYQMHVGWNLDLAEALEGMQPKFSADHHRVSSQLDYFKQLWNSFMDWIEQDIRSQCQALLSNGHDIRMAQFDEGETLWAFETKKYRITVSSYELDTSDNGMAEIWDESIFMETMNQLISGEMVMRNLRACVVELDTGNTLEEMHHHAVLLAARPDRRQRRMATNDIVREFINSIRPSNNVSCAEAA